MDIRKVLEDELNSVEAFLASFEFGMQEVQSDIFSVIISTILKMPVNDGNFEPSDKVKAALLRMEKRILEIIEKGQYSSELKNIVKNFSTIEEVNKQISSFINPKDKAKILKANTSKLRQGFINEVSSNLGSKEVFGMNIINPIKQILYQHSNGGATVKSAALKLFEFSMGSEPGGGKLATYAGQIAHDAIYGFNGSVDKAIGDFIEAQDVNYIGNIIPDSRPQCVRWVSKFEGFIPANQLKSEIAWAKKNGKGYGKNDPELTVDNFSIIRGGHRCRHIVKYSNGKATDKIREIEKERQRQSEAFNKDAASKLTGKSKALYEKQKAAVDALIKDFGK